MIQRLYAYHDTPLYFWLTPAQAESYNNHYLFLHQKISHLPLRDFERAIEVETKVKPRLELLERNGLFPKRMTVDRTIPLRIVY